MQEKLVLAIFNGFILSTILIFQSIIVKLSKKDMLLGIKIPKDKIESVEIKEMLKGYKKENSIVGIITLIINGIGIYFIDSIRFFFISIFIYGLVLLIIYLRWHRKAIRLKKKEGWEKLLKKELSKKKNKDIKEKDLEIISKGWFLIPLSIILLNIIFGLILYPILPDKLPIQWDLYGNINSYMDKSISGILLIPGMQLFLVGVIFLSYLGIKKGKHHINPRDPNRSLKKNIIFRKIWSVYFIFTLSLVEILLTILNMMTFGLITNIRLFNLFSFIILGFILVGAIVLSLILGQSGDRLNLEDDEEILHRNYINDKYWKLGNIIYFNPEDPTIFVEKRVGIGWTVNLGRPFGIILMVFPIIIAILALIFT